MMSRKFKLRSSNWVEFIIDESVIRRFKAIDTTGYGENDVIPLHKVDSAVLHKVIEWATHRKVSQDKI